MGIHRRRAVIHGLLLAGFLFNAYVLVVWGSRLVWFHDAQSWWTIDLAHLYDRARGDLMTTGAYRYAPPLAFLLAPFGVLPWPAFVALWTSLEVAALVWLDPRRWWLWLLAFPPVFLELLGGNIHLFMAVALALGLRYPAAWAFILLTKVTPGVGLLWFAVRREWRNLAIALGATALVVAVTLPLMPGLWADWLATLRESTGLAPSKDISILPLIVRLPLAALLVAWGARTDRVWTIPAAAILAMPSIWASAPVLLLAAGRLARPAAAEAAGVPRFRRGTSRTACPRHSGSY